MAQVVVAGIPFCLFLLKSSVKFLLMLFHLLQFTLSHYQAGLRSAQVLPTVMSCGTRYLTLRQGTLVVISELLKPPRQEGQSVSVIQTDEDFELPLNRMELIGRTLRTVRSGADCRLRTTHLLPRLPNLLLFFLELLSAVLYHSK
jgi:hypothetical protein